MLEGNGDISKIILHGSALLGASRQYHHPERMESFSPGLRGTSYPGFTGPKSRYPERFPPDGIPRIGPRNLDALRKSFANKSLSKSSCGRFLGRVASGFPGD